ncbi:CPBP family intramembrane glutamic endopeptidase [Dyella sp. C9]|uniref:CPBP family intramembrane glutamic endopeptidase n=1 Tax=Dyella sp. C9 TaxID=2202154 RepID=UPI000DEF4F2A|nr:CPBP family intramembrane glutamic endopeptidase [Dyella sp. C9]
MTLAWPGILHALCAALVLAFPFIDLPATKRLKRHTSRDGRLRLYRLGVCTAWPLALLLLISAGNTQPWALTPHGSELAWLEIPWLRATSWVLLAAFFTLAFWPGLHTLLAPEQRPRYARAMRRLRFMTPVSRQERWWWVAVSITAGVCEEWLYRGFLLHYLAGNLAGGPTLGLTAAWLLSSIAFGVAHLYQGRHGMVSTGIAGLAFGLMALLTGSLWLPMLVHSLIDLQVLVIYHPARDAPEEAAALVAGCSGE